MKILITGGAGYKGVVLAGALLRDGYSVTIADSFMNGYGSVLHLAVHPALTVVKVDVRSITNRELSCYDTVFHLAAIVGVRGCAANEFGARTINIDATKRLAELLDPKQRLVFASTTSLYGDNGCTCDETSPLKPVSLYGKTKCEAERYVMDRENSISLRFATVFGISPRMRTELLVNDFTYRACREKVLVVYSGDSRRTFLHIDDAVNGYAFALNSFDRMKSNIYNVGDESLNLSKLEIAQAVRKHVEFEFIKAQTPDVDVRNFEISFAKIRRLGFKIGRTLDDGIREMVRLYGYYEHHHHLGVI